MFVAPLLLSVQKNCDQLRKSTSSSKVSILCVFYECISILGL